jgi:hypothetical protein
MDDIVAFPSIIEDTSLARPHEPGHPLPPGKVTPHGLNDDERASATNAYGMLPGGIGKEVFFIDRIQRADAFGDTPVEVHPADDDRSAV